MSIDFSENYDELVAAARTAQQRGDKDRAYELFARASQVAPNAVEGWRGRAATSSLSDDVLLSLAYAVALDASDSARRKALERHVQERVAATTSDDLPTVTLLGQKLAEVGLTREANLLFHRATELDDTQVESLVWQAATEADHKQALAALRQAVAQNPKDTRARAGLEAVVQELNRAEQPRPRPAPVTEPGAVVAEPAAELVREGEQRLSLGNKARAHEAFVRATELSPRNEAAWLGRARAADDVDETLSCLEQALAINPDNMQAREARTFYRVRKLREGMRKTAEPPPEPPVRPPPFAGGGRFSEVPSEPVRQRRAVLLIIMIVVLLLVIFFLYLRLQA